VVTIAYLLCRIADTVEDEAVLDVPGRRALLERFSALTRLESGWEAHAARFAKEAVAGLRAEAPKSEVRLLEETPKVLEALSQMPRWTWPHIARCVGEMCAGMGEMAESLGERRGPAGLPDTEATLRYCYYVAGTVGVMLTGLFCDFSPKVAAQRDALEPRAAAFGRALQLTNIIKDMREDAERGFCWLPLDLLAEHGLTAATLLDEEKRPQAMALLDDLVALAFRETLPALEYTLAIPAEEPGLRLFCLWPLFFAVLTLSALQGNPQVFEAEPVKISRTQVAEVVAATQAQVADDTALRSLFEQYGGRLKSPSPATA
jgi:farnesyl-diphosphate farnesyltransferase